MFKYMKMYVNILFSFSYQKYKLKNKEKTKKTNQK